MDHSPPSGPEGHPPAPGDQHSHQQGHPQGEAQVVFQSRRQKDCAERALVLQAMQIPHGVQADGRGWILYVPSGAAEAALTELRNYEEERSEERRRPSIQPDVYPIGRRELMAYALIMALVYPIGRYGLFDMNFWMAGRMDSGAVLEGQWWRPITALFLHADLGHLVANVFFGTLFVALTSQLVGSGLAWGATLAAGALGNTLTTLIEGPGHLAIGASTAVFGTLGVFTFYEWVRRRRLREIMTQTQKLRIIAPLLAGSALLGFLGMGGGEQAPQGAKVDILSHLTGFVCGAGIGATYAWKGWPKGWSIKHQSRVIVGVLAVSACAWFVALAATG